MAYELYTSEKVFFDQNINSICNAIMDNLIAQFNEGTVNAAFGLTGSTARIMQGGTDTNIKVVAFVTDSQSIYSYLLNSIQNFINVTGVVGFTDRIQIITPRVYIEVWLTSNPITLIDLNGIYVQNASVIPIYIL